MHIDRLEIKGFGKLTDRNIFFKNGMNIIYGSNEAGKTTLQWFAKSMLYGLRNNRQPGNGPIPARKRFEPWAGGQYGGALVYTLDSGCTYRVERNFASGSVQLFDNLFNDVTGSFDTGRDKMPMFAEQQLGLDEATFERTVLIRQMGVRLDDDSAAALAGRLANLSSTGFEDISFSRAEKALTEALKNNVGTGRTTTQPMDKLEARLKQLGAESARLQKRQEQRHLTQEELLGIQKRRSRMEAERRFLEYIGGLIDIKKALDINLKKEAGLKDMVRRLKELEGAMTGIETDDGRRVAQAENKDTASLINSDSDAGRRTTHRSQQWRIVRLLCWAAAAAFALLLGHTAMTWGMGSSWRLLLFYSAGLLSAFIAGLLTFGKADRYQNKLAAYTTVDISGATVTKEDELRALVENICSNASMLCERRLDGPSAVKQALKSVTAELDELSRELEQGIDAAADMECNSAGHFNIKELDTLLYDSSAASLEEAWQSDMDSIKEGILEALLKEKYCEGLLEDGQGNSDELQRMEEETVAVKEKIAYLEYKGNALKLAHEVLLEAGLEIKRTFAPGLDSRLSRIITGLTAGRYMDLRGGDRLALNVAIPENGDIKSAQMLSGAATDQMYLALRLAMAELLTEGEENLPLIMDEVFSQFDDNRTAVALEYLHNTYEKRQVLIFTCKQREVELAREICGSSLNLVEL